MSVIAIFALLVILLTICIESSLSNYEAVGSCVSPASLADSHLITNVCGGIVDYPYFKPEAVSIDYMNQVAKYLVDDYRLYMLSDSCRIDHLINSCNTVYLRCGPGFASSNGPNKAIVIKDSQDYISLPCSSSCRRIRKSCLGYLENLYYQDKNSNCSIKVQDYYNLMYDYSPSYPNAWISSSMNLFNSNSNCVASSGNDPTIVTVSPMVEIYRPVTELAYISFVNELKSLLKVDYPSGSSYDGICRGITETVHIPPHQYLISASVFPEIYLKWKSKVERLAPLRPKFMVQAFLEVAVFDFMKDQVPPWVSRNCYESIRILVCKSVMQDPTTFKNLNYYKSKNFVYKALNLTKGMWIDTDGLANLTYHLPRYVSKATCDQYQDKCSSYIAYRSKHLPRLSVENCNASSVNALNKTVRHFPDDPQSVYDFAAQQRKMQLSFNLKYITNPSSMSLPADLGPNSLICPGGFLSTPGNDPTPDRTPLLIEGSSCAFACLTNLWSPAEWIVLKVFVIFIGIFASAIGIFVSIIHLFQDKSKSLIYVIYSISLSLATFIIFLSFIITPELSFCKSEVVRQTYGLNFCTIQSCILIVTLISGPICWFFMCLDIFLKVKWQVMAVRHFRALSTTTNFCISGGILAIALKYDQIGYRGGFSFCLFDDSSKFGSLILFVPIFIFNTAGWACLFALSRVYSKHRQTSFTDQLYLLYVHTVKIIRFHRRHLIIMFCGQLLWISLSIFLFVDYVWRNKIDSSVAKWTHCVFNHFLRNEMENWVDICGAQPLFYISSSTMTWITLILILQPLFMLIFYYEMIMVASKQWYTELMFIIRSKYDEVVAQDVTIESLENKKSKENDIELNKEKEKERKRDSEAGAEVEETEDSGLKPFSFSFAIDRLLDSLLDYIYKANSGDTNDHDVGKPRLLAIILTSNDRFSSIFTQKKKRIARVGDNMKRFTKAFVNSAKHSNKVEDIFAAHNKKKAHEALGRHGAIAPSGSFDVNNYNVDIRHHTKEQIDAWVKRDQEADAMADLFMGSMGGGSTLGSSASPRLAKDEEAQSAMGTASQSTSSNSTRPANNNNSYNNDAVSRKMIIFC